MKHNTISCTPSPVPTLLCFVVMRGVTRHCDKTTHVKKNLYTVRGVSVVGWDPRHTVPWPTTPDPRNQDPSHRDVERSHRL